MASFGQEADTTVPVDRQVTREKLFPGRRVKYTLRSFGCQLMIVLSLTDKGFKYVWAERNHLGPRYGFTDGGEVFENGYAFCEVVDVDQQP